jgi:hypothetical protein
MSSQAQTGGEGMQGGVTTEGDSLPEVGAA